MPTSSYSPLGARGRQQSTLSSEDEHGGFVDEGDAAKRLPQSSSPSPWRRMKWTDSMGRLLISAVYHTADNDGDGGAEGPHGPATSSSAAKGKKPGSGSASSASSASSALLQKKGKWKSVSRAMMERGFFVSPQQCEDKFNDLNKRYKRVNELLGKGTACRVVENPALLDTLDHLTPSAKEEARKLLNSKHLFFREMCAYHNPPEATATAASSCAPQHPPQAQPPSTMAEDKRHCFYHPAGQGKGAAGEAVGLEAMPEEEEEDDKYEHLDDEEEDDDDYGDDDGGDDHQNSKHQKHKEVEADEDEERKGFMGNGRKRARTTSRPFSSSASPPLSLFLSSTLTTSTYIQQLRSELTGLAGEGEPQQRQWLQRKAVELEEQRVGYRSRAFQLERQRLRWLCFSTNKEREMERMRLHNDRLRLENERMMLLLRQKELELTSSSSAGDSSAASRFQQMLMPPLPCQRKHRRSPRQPECRSPPSGSLRAHVRPRHSVRKITVRGPQGLYCDILVVRGVKV